MAVEIETRYTARARHEFQDVPAGACFLQRGNLWVKQEGGYCLSLEALDRVLFGPTTQVDQIFSKITITAE